MRTVVVAFAAIAIMASAIFATPALARGGGKGKAPGADQQSEAQKQKNAAAEKAYKAAIDRIPDKKKSDPWGSMR